MSVDRNARTTSTYCHLTYVYIMDCASANRCSTSSTNRPLRYYSSTSQTHQCNTWTAPSTGPESALCHYWESSIATFTMSTKLGLLDLPGELLMRILELHYENVKVKINPFSRRLLYWDAEFLWPRMSCKLLGELAETSFFENAEVYIDTEDMVSFKDFFESSPFDESTKHPIVSRHTTRDHSILYPVQLFRHLSLGRLSFTNYLSKALDQAQKMPKGILETFPFLQSLLAECTIWLPRQQTGRLSILFHRRRD